MKNKWVRIKQKDLSPQLQLFKFLRSLLHETLSLTLKSIHLLIIQDIFQKGVELHLDLFAHSKIKIYLKVRSTTNSFMSKKLHFHQRSTQLRVVCLKRKLKSTSDWLRKIDWSMESKILIETYEKFDLKWKSKMIWLRLSIRIALSLLKKLRRI